MHNGAVFRKELDTEVPQAVFGTHDNVMILFPEAGPADVLDANLTQPGSLAMMGDRHKHETLWDEGHIPLARIEARGSRLDVQCPMS